MRAIYGDSYLCRIRGVRVSSPVENISDNNWADAETAWPSTIVMILNTKALEIRRKPYHEMDFPVDVSQYVQEGENTLRMGTIWSQESEAVYAVGFETLQVAIDK